MRDPSPFWKRIISVLVGCFVINFSIWLNAINYDTEGILIPVTIAALGGRELLAKWFESQ